MLVTRQSSPINYVRASCRSCFCSFSRILEARKENHSAPNLPVLNPTQRHQNPQPFEKLRLHSVGYTPSIDCSIRPPRNTLLKLGACDLASACLERTVDGVFFSRKCPYCICLGVRFIPEKPKFQLTLLSRSMTGLPITSEL